MYGPGPGAMDKGCMGPVSSANTEAVWAWHQLLPSRVGIAWMDRVGNSVWVTGDGILGGRGGACFRTKSRLSTHSRLTQDNGAHGAVQHGSLSEGTRLLGGPALALDVWYQALHWDL